MWTYQIYGTGHPVPDGGLHCGTVIDGPYVWHLYMLTSPFSGNQSELL